MASQNLARMVFGSVTLDAGATITSETHTAYLGKYLILSNINVQSFTSLTDVGAATTYTAGTDYEIIDLAAGMILILDGGAITEGQEVEANYATGDSEVVSAFSKPNTEYWLRFNGLNTAENNNPVVIDLL